MAMEKNILWHSEHLSNNALRERGFLTGNEAHIWYACTEGVSESILRYYGALSEKEKTRAERFHKRNDQHNYVVAQVIKRLVLSAYIGCHPEEIEFEHNQYGKPFLSNSNIPVMFNVAHTKNIILLAVTKGTEVGIDVEYNDTTLDWHAIAHKFFSTDELQHIESCTAEEKAPLFFSYWTQKEAILKARGVGLFDMEVANFKHGSLTTVPFMVATNYLGWLAISQTINCVRAYSHNPELRPPKKVFKRNAVAGRWNQ
jgi:4'-phosphopantetheinyl transferase